MLVREVEELLSKYFQQEVELYGALGVSLTRSAMSPLMHLIVGKQPSMEVLPGNLVGWILNLPKDPTYTCKAIAVGIVRNLGFNVLSRFLNKEKFSVLLSFSDWLLSDPTEVIHDFDDLCGFIHVAFIFEKGPDSVLQHKLHPEDLLFNQKRPEEAARLRRLITSTLGLAQIIRYCPSLADKLLFNNPDAAWLRGLIATIYDLAKLIALCPSLAGQLLFNPDDREDAARLRGFITTTWDLIEIIGCHPSLADKLLLNSDDPEDAARLRELMSRDWSSGEIVKCCCYVFVEKLRPDDQGCVAITREELVKVVVMASLSAALADWNCKFSEEFLNFLSKKPISEESGEAAAGSVPSTFDCSEEFIRLLKELISLSESRKEKLEKEIGADCLLALSKPSENPFSILAYAIALSEFNAVPESELEYVQNAESALNKSETKEAEALAENLGAQVRAKNLLEAARYLLSIPGVNVNPIAPASDVFPKDLRNAVVLSRVFLFHIQSGLIGLKAEENPALEAYREAIRNTVGAIGKILPDVKVRRLKIETDKEKENPASSQTTEIAAPTQTAETTFFASTQKATPDAHGPMPGST